jgi:alanine-glyoxylate transaminase/serine-glyoxylate transaminase/serine-pyruvate transaminase
MIPVPVEVDPSQPLDPAAFERALASDAQIVGIAAVHLETSTSILNPVREIAAVAHKHNLLCLIDAVASLAGTDLRMDEWGIDVCTSASQKGLGGVPGLAIVAVGPRGWERIVNQAERPRSWYLDLRRWQWYAENWGDWHPFPVTMPTSVVLALRAALQSLLKEGLEARFKHYNVLAARLRNGLKSMGFTLFADESLMAPVLTAVNCPPGSTSEQIGRYLETEHNIKITTGFGPYKNTVIRIGHMGGAINEADIDGLLAGLAEWNKVLQR